MELAIVTTIATVVIAISTGISGWSTYHLAQDNRRLRRAGTEPHVVAYIVIDHRHRECLNVVIRNIGNGPAYNVKMAIDTDQNDFGEYVVGFKERPERPPLPLLPPGEKLESFLNVGFKLFHKDGSPKLDPFHVKITFRNTDDHNYQTEQTLDVAPFRGLVTIGKPAEHEIAQSLTQIAELLGKFSTGPQRLKVETITTAEEEERTQRAAERAQAKRGQGSDG